jgi:hypothetical protein
MAAVADVPHGLTRGEILDKLGLKGHKTTETSVSNALTVLTSSCEGRVHGFDRICRANAIEHRLAKAYHPWTNGQVERMNRTIKEATVNRYHYETHDQLRTQLADIRFRPQALRHLDKRTRPIHPRSSPSNAGTKHRRMLNGSSGCCGRGTWRALLQEFGLTQPATTALCGGAKPGSDSILAAVQPLMTVMCR